MRKGIIIGGVAAAVVLIAGIANAAGGDSTTGTATAGQAETSSSSSSSSSAAPTTPADTTVTVPALSGITVAQATTKLKNAGLVISATGDTSNPQYVVLSQTPANATRAEKGSTVTVVVGESPAQVATRVAAEKAAADAAAKAAEEAAQAAADGDLSTYQEIDTRTWALVAKDPEAHKGEKYVIYGKVTQFDSATGKSTFRANTDGVQQEQSYDYDVNTIISAKDATSVGDLVTDDLVKMYVRVTGSLTYDTQIGGSTTVPQAVVLSHELLGHDD